MKRKEARIEIVLVPESDSIANRRLSLDVKKTLKCDWLLQVKSVTVYEEHHGFPSGRKVETT